MGEIFAEYCTPSSGKNLTKKQAGKTILFISIFLILVVMLTYMLRTNGDVKDRLCGFYAEPKDSVDAVIIGSSPVFPCYSSPQIFGETGIVMYPMSTDLQRPVAQLYYAKEAISKQHPDLLIFEVRMYTGNEHDMTNNMANSRGATDNLKYSKNRIDLINAMLDESKIEGGISDSDKEPYTYYFDIFKYHSNWRSLSRPKQWLDALFSYPDPQKGFFITDDVAPMELTDWSDVDESTPIPDPQDEYLTELLDYLNEEGQDALFILTPFDETKEQAEMFNYMQERIEESGFTYLDMNDHIDEIGFDPSTDFKDYGVHTNASGSEKVTSWFEQYLVDNYDLKDHRGESHYDSWQEAYEQWQVNQQDAMAVIEDHVANGTYAAKTDEAQDEE